MKKKLLFVLLLCAFFISCGQKQNPDPDNIEQPDTPVKPEKPDNPTKENKDTRSISLQNKSSYPVSVYFRNNPETGVTPFAEINAKTTIYEDIELDENDENGSVFYFIYNLNFGQNDVYFPYYPEEDSQNHKIVNLTKEDKVIIDEIQTCKTKSSFIFLENNTSSNIMLKLKYTRVKPYHKEDELLAIGETGVYEIGNTKNASFQLDFINDVKIEADALQYELPKIDYEAGKIYTITVSNTENGASEKIKATLKAISPFNVDTANKMWGFSESSFLYNWDDRITPVIKPAYNKENGSIMMGTLKNNRKSIGVLPVDQYGIYPEEMNVLEAWTNNIPKDKIDTLTVSDFVEQSDGSFVMLLSCWDENYYINYMLIAFDFSKNLVLWEEELPEELLFRHDSANKLIRLEDNKVVIAGGITIEPENPEDYGEEDPYPMSPYISIFDYTTKKDNGLTYERNADGCKTYKMDTPFDNESLFCSAYYDGTNIYACGFTDCDYQYKTVEHDGIIYKFNADLSEPEEIYKKQNCLFFTLSGNGNKWYTCGEYWLKESDRLLGCYVSSTMIAEDKTVNPTYYFGASLYTWFNQLCTYDNMIVMCGQTSEDYEAQVNPIPFVVAYDANGKQLWENLSYKGKWATALNVIPNTIGTYILQLTDKNNKQIRFVSADFLGKEVIK